MNVFLYLAQFSSQPVRIASKLLCASVTTAKKKAQAYKHKYESGSEHHARQGKRR